MTFSSRCRFPGTLEGYRPRDAVTLNMLVSSG
jgi:hypothetical protein